MTRLWLISLFCSVVEMMSSSKLNVEPSLGSTENFMCFLGSCPKIMILHLICCWLETAWKLQINCNDRKILLSKKYEGKTMEKVFSGIVISLQKMSCADRLIMSSFHLTAKNQAVVLLQYPSRQTDEHDVKNTVLVMETALVGIGPTCRGFPWCRPN